MRFISRFGMLVFIGFIAVLIGIFIVVQDVPNSAVIALIGVIVGSLIGSSMQYWIAESGRIQQLRLAALDRRLEASQDAYHLWRRLVFADKRSGEVFDIINECQDWWDANCLFLSGDARTAFHKAFSSAGDHAQFLKTHESSVLVRDAWTDVIRAGPIIEQSVYLPAIINQETLLKLGNISKTDA